MNQYDTELELTPALLLKAYSVGLFPMAETRTTKTVFWVAPKKRGILPINEFHVPRRLRRTVRNGRFKITCNADFATVVAMCAESAEGRLDTWINPEIEAAVNELNKMGFAHSIECRLQGELVGGLYGISLGAAFFGESMFSRVRDASKVALVNLVTCLTLGGFRLLDMQFMTDHLSQFGTIEVTSEDYQALLNEALQHQATFPETINIDEWPTTLNDVISK